MTFSGTRETFFLGTKLQGFQRWPTFSGFQSWGSQKTGPVLVVFWGFVGDDISYPGCSGDLCENFCKRMRAQVYLYIVYLYHDTVDGMNPANSPVEGTVVEIPLFTTGFIHVRWCRISEPSTVCHVFWPNGIILHQPRFP